MYNRRPVSGFLVIFLIGFFAKLDAVAKDVQTLRKELFVDGRYDHYNRPHGSGSHINDSQRVVSIEVYLRVLHIYDVEDFSGTLVVNGWLLAVWEDLRLKWEPTKYGKVDILKVPREFIWVPDLVLLNNVEALSLETYGETVVNVFSRGYVHWTAPLTFKATCPVDHTFYPYDEFNCTLMMSLWSEATDHFTLAVVKDPQNSLNQLMMNYSIENPQWELVTQTQQIRNKTWSCCANITLQMFEIDLHLRRHAPLHRLLLLTPIALSILLTLSIFWLPVISPRKFTCAGLAMAIQVVSLLYLGLKLPPGTLGAPAIVVVCGNALAMTVTSVITSVIVIGFGHSRRHIPNQMKSLMKRGTWVRIIWFGMTGSQILLDDQDSSEVKFARMNQEYVESSDNQKLDVDFTINKDDIPTIISSSRTPKEEPMLASVIDRLCFIVFVFAYAVIGISTLL